MALLAAPLQRFILLFHHRNDAQIRTQCPSVGAPPQPMIAKILIYKDRDLILRHACEARDIHYESGRIDFPRLYHGGAETT